MPDGNSAALFTGLVLAVVSFATLTFIRRSRLRSRYLSSDEGLKGSGIPGVGAAAAHGANGQGTSRGAGEAGGNEESEGGKDDDEEKELPALLRASPPCWQNPLVLGFNKLKPRTTLGAFSSVQQAR